MNKEQIQTINTNGVEALYIDHSVLITLKSGDKIQGILDAIAGDRMLIVVPEMTLPITIKRSGYDCIIPIADEVQVDPA